MVNTLDGSSRNVSGELGNSRSFSHSTGSNTTEYGNLQSSVDSNWSGYSAVAGSFDGRTVRDRPSSTVPAKRRPFSSRG